jgi:hypothetical protein
MGTESRIKNLATRFLLLRGLLASAWPLLGQEVKFIDLSATRQRTELRYPPSPPSDCNEGGCLGGGSGGVSVGDGAPDPRDPRAPGIYVLAVFPINIAADKPFETEFKVFNSGRANIELPVSLHLSDLQPSDESTAFSYLTLALVVSVERDTQSGRVPCSGFVQLFGSHEREGTLLVLRPGEWIRVRATVKLAMCSLDEGPVELRGKFWLRRNTFHPQPGGAFQEIHNLYPNTTPTPSVAAHLSREPDRSHKYQ